MSLLCSMRQGLYTVVANLQIDRKAKNGGRKVQAYTNTRADHSVNHVQA
jgi:hypothetical protein